MSENEAPLNILQLMDPSRTLISPPPEEELQFGFPRSNSSVQPKRKRNGPGGTPSKEATPNPKPRKAHRRQSSVQRDQHPIVEAESPTHATFLRRSQNPNADWLPIPGTSKTNSRRSVTPYEPPTDVFTPPQEIIRQTPVQALKARQRTTTPQTRTRTPLRVVVQTSIKKEMPAIDLSRPIDPPSPTDDPLLLLPSSSPIKFGRNLNDSSSDLPPILDWTTGPIVDTTDYPTSDSMDLDQPESFDGPMPLEGPVPAGWDSDSDEDDGNLPLPSLPHCQQQQLPRYSASPVPRTSLSLANFLPVRSHTTPPRARSRPFSPSPGPPVVIPETTPSTPTTSRPRPSTPPPSSANESYTTVVRRTKPDPATPETKARAEAWGIWGSPYPGRGTDGEGNGSFRMDGSFRRGKLLGDLSGDGAGPSVEQEEDEDEDEEMEEGVSFLRALREEDEAFARKKSAAQDEQGEGMDQGEEEEEGEDDMDEGEDMQEEEEVRQMSVELEDEEQEPIIAPTPIRPQVQQTRNLVTATMPVQTPPIRRVPFVPARAELASSSNSAPFVHQSTPADADTSTESTSSVSPGPSVYIARGTRPPSAASGYVDAGEEIEDVLSGDVADRDDSEGDDDMDSDLLGLVKITSADPRAAARAAAILKQHDYDCFTRLRDKDKRRRHSFAGVSKTKVGSPASSSKVQDIAELRAKARAKELEEKKEKRARRQSARVVGERVYFPGSPVPVTTTELLAEAEREVVSSGMLSPAKAGRAVGESISASTPVPSRTARSGRRSSLAREVPLPDSDDDDEEQEQDRVREWTKADWKTLDACFTDERIAVAQRLEMVLNLSVAPVAVPATLSFSTPVKRQRPQTDYGDAAADVVMMASADAVDLAAVVRRFEHRMGGKDVLKEWGDSWAEETLTQRVRALQNKQRAGHVAPPTPRAAAATIDEDGNVFSKRRPNMEVPDFTPLGKRAMPPSRRSRLPDPVQGGLFSNLPPTPEPAKRRRVPGSLLAPRYSHLLEEARAVAGPSSSSAASAAQDVEGQDEEIQDEQTQDSSFASDESDGDAEMLPATPLREREEEQFPAQPVAPATIGNRVKGFIFSYLPTLAKTAPAAASRAGLLHSRPRLPLPPLDILQKPRGPVTTPARPPLPKTTAPKDLVTLQPAPMPPPKTMIQRKVPPRRMKELKHVSPPPEQQPEQRVGPRPRTSSGGSVKDMVKNFEALDQARGKAPPEVKRVRSVGNFVGKNAGGPGRPAWR